MESKECSGIACIQMSKWLCSSTAHGARALYTRLLSNKTAVSNCMGLFSFPFLPSPHLRERCFDEERGVQTLFLDIL